MSPVQTRLSARGCRPDTEECSEHPFEENSRKRRLGVIPVSQNSLRPAGRTLPRTCPVPATVLSGCAHPRPQCPAQSARSVADLHPEVRGLLTGGQAGCREGRNSWAARRGKTPAGRVHGLAGVRLQQTRLPRRGSEVSDPDSLPCQDHREFTHARHAQSLLSAPGPAGGGTPRMFVLPTCSARAAVTRGRRRRTEPCAGRSPSGPENHAGHLGPAGSARKRRATGHRVACRRARHCLV